MDEILIHASAVSRPPIERHGSPDPRGADARWARGVGAHVEAHSDRGAPDKRWTLGDVAAAVGTYRREVRRVGWRYLERGVLAALSDDPRPTPPKLLDTHQEADRGDGLWVTASWLCAVDGPRDHRGNEATRDRRGRGPRDGAPSAGRPRVEAVAEKMWCVPTLDAEYIENMKDVLDVLARPYDAREPVVTLDERPVALRGASRPGRPMAAGQIAREDYECVRTGTANIYCIVEPKAGRHVTHATRDRKAPRFVSAVQRMARRYSKAKTDPSHHGQLESARAGALIRALGSVQGAALWARFTPHYTPKHGSWLNPAEIEGQSVVPRMSRPGSRRHIRSPSSSHARMDRARRPREAEDYLAIHTAKARRVFRYKRRRTMSRSRH